MADEQNQQKQDGDKDSTGTQTDGFNADKLGQASSYDDPTQIAQQMQHGDASQGDPDARSTAGATAFKDTEEGRTDKDTTHHVHTPDHKDSTIHRTKEDAETDPNEQD
ncbi:MAG: hypothetical protein MSG64_14595 [Pyrinomonadaceae bacterium MAG19_C2-C3]|nr:hypothetical protein [Pyrinomonadaceae bacterium MAG19_C2-C3]